MVPGPGFAGSGGEQRGVNPVHGSFSSHAPKGVRPPWVVFEQQESQSSKVEDSVDIGGTASVARPKTESNTEVKPRGNSWLRTIRNGILIATVAGVAAASTIGGIAYFANRDALSQTPQVTLYAPAPAASAATPKSQVHGGGGIAPKAGAIQMTIPASTLQRLEQMPQAQALMQERLQVVQGRLQKEMGALEVAGGHQLMDVTVPLPIGPHALLRVGNTDLPSAGLRSFQVETVPFALDFTTRPVKTGLEVHLRPVKPEPNLKGPGLLLGAVRAELTSKDGRIPVQGDLRLHLDLDGSKTSQELKQAKGQPQLAAQLKQRLQSSQELAKRVDEAGLRDTLKAAADHQLAFSADLEVGKGTVAGSTLYLWAVQDPADGKMHVKITQKQDLSRLDQMGIKLHSLKGVGPNPEGGVAKLVHAQGQKALQAGLQQTLGKLTSELQDVVRQRVEHGMAERAGKLEATTDGELQALMRQHSHLEIPTGQPLLPKVGIDLNSVQVTPQGLLVQLSPTGMQANQRLSGPVQPLEAGQVDVAVGLNALNRQLQGVDWTPMLAQARQKADLESLEFARNEQGRPVLPWFAAEKGRLTLNTEVVAKVGGALTQATVHRRITVPLNLGTQDGHLSVKVDGPGIQFRDAQRSTSGGFDPMDLLPTRLIANLVVNGVAGEMGPQKLGQQLNGHGLELDLTRDLGVRFDSARLGPDGSLHVVARLPK